MDTNELRRRTSLRLTATQLKLKPESTDDWVRVTNKINAVIKIQSYFKRQAACARV